VIIDPDSFLVVVIVAAFSPLIAALVNRLLPGVIVPIVVAEIVLGALVGPHGLDLAAITPTLNFLATLGLGFLFFFAGYEIDFKKIRGAPLWLAVLGWGISLVLAYTFAGLLAAAGVVISGLLTGSAMSTTAIGTILPVLQDTGQLKGRFGPMMLAAGAIGELGPILIVTLLLSTQSDTGSQALLLAAFVLLTIVAAVASHATFDRAWPFLDRTMDTSGQVPIRLTVLLVFALVVIASKLGLDIILGAFAAGMIVRMLLEGRDPHRFESKIDAVGFGFLIPFFFIQSGMNLDLAALGGSIHAVLKVPLFLLAFLVVRGTPALLLYRGALDRADRKALALFSSTELPLVVAITSLGVRQGEMRPSTAVALVTAAVLSVLIFPSLAISIRRHDKPEPTAPPVAELTVDPATG
jgi:Kef-type K+ transport system membrane component KefB